MNKTYTLCLLLFLSKMAFGQKDSLPKNVNGFKVIALPVVFYTPDTKIGGGVGGLTTFNFKKDSIGARRSSVTVGLVYTQLKQVLVYFPFQLFPKNQKYWFGGEVGYYKYIYNFFGTGNDFSPDYIEKFSATYPRIRFSATKQIKSHLFVGFRFGYEDFTFTKVDSGGILYKKLVVGAMGGRHACLGLQMNYDSRDALFSPTKGWVVDQKISAGKALLAYTKAGAYSSFEESVKGQIASGFLADIVVLSQDLFKADPMRVYESRVVMTIFDGKVIYRDSKSF